MKCHEASSHLFRPEPGASLEGDDDAFGDLLTWTDAAAFEATGTEMQAMPELAPFFQGVDHIRVFSLFRRDGVE